MSQFMLSEAVLDALVATSTSNFYTGLLGILPELMVFAVGVGVLFLAVRWVKSIISGHGNGA